MNVHAANIAGKLGLKLVLSFLIPSVVTVSSWLLIACLDGTCSLATALSNVYEDPKVLIACILSGTVGLMAALIISTSSCLWHIISKQLAVVRGTEPNSLAGIGNQLPLTSWLGCIIASQYLCQSLFYI